MSLTKFVGLLAGSTLTLTGVSYGANEVNNDTQAQLDSLKAELAALKSQQGEQWLTEQRAAQVRGIVQDVLADADTRASLQTTAATSGYDNGFFISSADGNFKLKITALEQIRFVYNNQYNPGAASVPPENTWGMENRRTQVWFTGNVVDPTWTYVLGISVNDQQDPYYQTLAGGGNLSFALGYAYVRKTFDAAGGKFWIQFGQFSAPWTQQSQLWSAGNTQAGEYSAFEYLYGVGLTTGFLGGWQNDMLRVQASLSNKFTPLTATFGAPTASAWNDVNNASVAFAGRADFKIAGDWAQFDNESSFKGQAFGAKVGGAILYSTHRAQNLPGSADPFGATVDAMIDFGGANLIGQFAYMDDMYGFPAGGDTYGLNISGGFFLTEEFEIFGGWTWNSADFGAPFPGRSDGSVVSFGGNWYIAKNNIKATLAVLIPISVDTAGTSGEIVTVPLPPGMGFNGAGSNNLSVMAQLQLMF
jgi:hypothetical protein